MRKIIKAIVAAGAATVAVALVYGSVQQSYRTAGDDPQIQLASDAAAALHRGAAIEQVVPSQTIDVTASLAPFVIVYDAADHPLAGSGQLDGALPAPPSGVLAAARRSGTHRVSWMPRPRVRMAAVLVAVSDGRVVLAARSLREVEERQSRLLVMSALGWAVLMVASVAAALL